VAHYTLCRVHEAQRTAPAVVLGVADRVWTLGDSIDADVAPAVLSRLNWSLAL